MPTYNYTQPSYTRRRYYTQPHIHVAQPYSTRACLVKAGYSGKALQRALNFIASLPPQATRRLLSGGVQHANRYLVQSGLPRLPRRR